MCLYSIVQSLDERIYILFVFFTISKTKHSPKNRRQIAAVKVGHTKHQKFNNKNFFSEKNCSSSPFTCRIKKQGDKTSTCAKTFI